MHNYAIFAIPGLMPPKAAHWRSRLISPEDGSLKLLVYCGRKDDEVHYTITIPGHRRGIIKDPTYEFENHDLEDRGAVVPCEKQKEKWPNFLVRAGELPEGVMVPKVIIHGCPIPLTEICEECKEKILEEEGDTAPGGSDGPQIQPGLPGPSIGDEPESTPPLPEPYFPIYYYYLDCPPRTLPYGDTVIEVVAKGRLRRFIVRRPDFNIHHRGGITMRYRRFKPEEEEEN